MSDWVVFWRSGLILNTMAKKTIVEARKMLIDYLSAQAKEKGLNQDKLAELTGFTQSNISRLFSHKYPPTLETFMTLADAIGCYYFIIDKEDKGDLADMMRNRWGKVSNNY